MSAWVATLMIVGAPINIEANKNGAGADVSRVTTSNVGIKVSQMASGHRIVATISPYVARSSRNPRGLRITVGPKSMVAGISQNRVKMWLKYK